MVSRSTAAAAEVALLLVAMASAAGPLAACGGKTDDANLATLRVGTAKGDPNDPPPPEPTDGVLTPVSVCQRPPPFQTGFEDPSIDHNLQISFAASFTLDANAPIAGKQSLRVAPGGQLEYAIPSACRVRFTLTIRAGADLPPASVGLAAILAGSRQVELRVASSRLSLVQLASTSTSGTDLEVGTLGAFDTIAAKIAIELDLAGGLVRAARDADPPIVAPLVAFPAGDRSADPAITGVVVATGEEKGTYWIDDVSIGPAD